MNSDRWWVQCPEDCAQDSQWSPNSRLAPQSQPRRHTGRRANRRTCWDNSLIKRISIDTRHSPTQTQLETSTHPDRTLQEGHLQDRYAQLLRTTCRWTHLDALPVFRAARITTVSTPTGVIMLSVRTVEMDETISSMLCWNETEPRTLGTSLEQRAAPGAKMSLYYPSWRTLHIFFATITAVLTQGTCFGSHWLCVALYLNRNCPSRTSVKPVYNPKRDEWTWSLLRPSQF